MTALSYSSLVRPKLGHVTSPKQIVGGALVDSLTHPTLLLVARRTAPPEFAGMWEFPGGKVEPGEGAREALHRELAEELGVTVELGAELHGPTPEGWPLNSNAAMRVWLAQVTDGSPEPLEDHDELRWVELAGPEVLELAWIPADLPIVLALQAADSPR
jgi:8-oxo-dGTP diphosphatase